MTRISSWFFIIVYLLYVLTLGVQMNDVSHLTNPPTLRCDFGYSDTNLQCLLHEIEFSVYPNVNHNLMSVCNILMIEFSDKVSDFMGCAVINARPFGMCESCVSFYNNMTDVYQRILSVSM